MPLAKEIIRETRAQLVSLGNQKEQKNDTVYQRPALPQAYLTTLTDNNQ